METIKIIKATVKDIDKLQKIGKKTFQETFGSDNSEEDMKEYLEEGFSKQKIATELADENSQFYIAEFGDNVIGYLKINTGQSQTEIKDENALEIERIYVLKEYQGKKVGQILYEKAIKISRQEKVNYVWLGVWEKNPRAIRFYQKNGFIEFDKHIFRLGDDQQTDIMMKLDLEEKRIS